MDRKKFLKKGLIGFGAILAIPTVVSSCSKQDDAEPNTGNTNSNCAISPTETVGPFPIVTPTQLVRSSIISDRQGVALLFRITINDQSNDCNPMAGVLVDVWQCDKDGNYSQYGGNQSQATDYRNQSFLRGRQTTNENGQVSFLSIFPGWYPGRAPHIHVQVLSANGASLLVTQIAFPVSAYTAVYATNGYNGTPDRSNTQDSIFANSLSANMADSCTGNVTDGYTLLKTITVA